MWAARVMTKAFLYPGETCTPGMRHKRPPRVMSCRWRNWRLSCGCRGWTQIAAFCVQPCHEHGKYSHDTGLYCHVPCNYRGQLKLRTGCGIGYTRTCVHDTKACVLKVVNHAIDFAEMLAFIGSAGAYGRMKKGFSKVRKLGAKAALKELKKQFRQSARDLAAKAMQKGFIREQVKNEAAGAAMSIFEAGALMMLTANIPTSWGAVAWEIAAAVDPTGVIGVAKGFVPPADCDTGKGKKGGVMAHTNFPQCDAEKCTECNIHQPWICTKTVFGPGHPFFFPPSFAPTQTPTATPTAAPSCPQYPYRSPNYWQKQHDAHYAIKVTTRRRRGPRRMGNLAQVEDGQTESEGRRLLQWQPGMPSYYKLDSGSSWADSNCQRCYGQQQKECIEQNKRNQHAYNLYKKGWGHITT